MSRTVSSYMSIYFWDGFLVMRIQSQLKVEAHDIIEMIPEDPYS